MEAALESVEPAMEQLEQMIDDDVDADRARQTMQLFHCFRASSLSKLDRHDEAIAEWDNALALTTPQGTPSIR